MSERLRQQGRPDWEVAALTRLGHSGERGLHAVGFVSQRNAPIRFGRQPTGAKWTLWGMLFGPPLIVLNAARAELMRQGRDAWTLSAIAHEVKHYEQGFWVALSVYGELEAWQLQIQVLRDLGAPPRHAAYLAIEQLPLTHDPAVLHEAARLMREASPGYRSDLLPLNPLPYTLRSAWQRWWGGKG